VSQRPAALRDARRSCASLTRITAAGIALVSLATVVAGASPYLPADDASVLERVPERSDLERLAPLRAAVAADPGDLGASLALATGYIGIGRRNSDPRFIGHAQAALSPWLSRPHPPERVLVLEAIALQYLHQFDPALALLERALELEPLDSQAWLTRATILELRGDYTGARRACARLVRTADEFSALTCLGSVAGRNGELASSYRTLQSAGLDPRLPAALRAWRLSVVAEMAERLGDDRTAEVHLRAALQVAGDDPYVKAAYADLLLRTGRAPEVIALLSGSEAQDPLLLRLAVAGHRLGTPEAVRWTKAFEERLRTAESNPDNTHLRERAMYLLEVRGDAAAALDSAERNWAVQREPADLRIYARAAERSHATADVELIARWLRDTRYEDRTLCALIGCGAPREAP
jgi:tetratricopeptide (TPR) repeat protein